MQKPSQGGGADIQHAIWASVRRKAGRLYPKLQIFESHNQKIQPGEKRIIFAAVISYQNVE